jgi:hypothetical protein
MNPAGRMDQAAFRTGRPYISQRDINPGNRSGMMQRYDEMVSPAAEDMQDALLRLLGNPDPHTRMNTDRISRIAADPKVLALLKAMPAAAAVGGAVGAGDLVAGEESFANKGMDTLGMVAGGAYGMRNTRFTGGNKALALLAGLGVGKMGSDAIQGGIGGIM